MNNIMCYTEACLNLNFEALHKLMFNETVCLEVFAALSNWLNTSTSRGHFISRTSLAALMRHVLSCCVKPVFSTALLCPCLPGLQKYHVSHPATETQQQPQMDWSFRKPCLWDCLLELKTWLVWQLCNIAHVSARGLVADKQADNTCFSSWLQVFTVILAEYFWVSYQR